MTEGVEMEVIGWEWEEKVREDEGPGGGWRKEAIPAGFYDGMFSSGFEGRVAVEPSAFYGSGEENPASDRRFAHEWRRGGMGPSNTESQAGEQEMEP